MDIGVNVITQQREHQHSSKLVLSLKQLSLFSSLLALMMLSFAGLLPSSGGYSFTILGFASARQLVDGIRARLSSGVLFVLTNAIIVAILSTSGCFKAVADQQDTESSLATADFLPAPVPLEHNDEPPQRSSSMPRLEEEEDQQHSKKTLKKVKRQVSSPAALDTTQPSRTKAIVVGKPRPAKAASFQAPAPAPAEKGSIISSDSFNLVTCEQKVFNQIVESYIDKFRQDMRQQEMQSVVNGQLFASRAPN